MPPLIEVEFKPPFILLKSGRIAASFERFGRTRAAGALGWLSLGALPFIAGAGLTLLLLSFLAILSRPEVQEAQRQIGPQGLLLIPGLNPYLPILYGWLALVIALVVHEGMHGVLARRLGYTVRSSGIILFLILPIGAFVETDDNEIRTGRVRDVSRILAGGPAANVGVALISLAFLATLTIGLQPAPVMVVEEVFEGSPAMEAGLRPGDVLLAVNGRSAVSLTVLSESVSSAGYGGEVELEVARPEAGTLRLRVGVEDLGMGRPMIGVRIGNAEIQEWSYQYLDSYKRGALSNPLIFLLPPSFYPAHPFSQLSVCQGDEGEPRCWPVSDLFRHPLLGDSYLTVANALYWIWFVNFNVGIFNALPIYPLDGGQILRRLLSASLGTRIGEGGVRIAVTMVSLVVTGIVISLFTVPYLAPLLRQ
jgi:hypothetical protein